MNTTESYFAPRSLIEATQQLAKAPATLLAGGTDLMLQLESGQRKAESILMNLRRIPELEGIDARGSTLRMGALTTITEIRNHPLIRESVSILSTVADKFASDQIRNAATIGGNICNASPAGDMLVPLLLLDAEVELESWKGNEQSRRLLPLSHFLIGPGKTRLEPDELLSAIRLKVPSSDHVAVFSKFGTRPALDISIVSVGIAANKREGKLENVHVVFGAVAPTPIRGQATEALLEGQALNDSLIARAASLAREEISPISDIRASAWYRRSLVGTLTERLLHDVC